MGKRAKIGLEKWARAHPALVDCDKVLDFMYLQNLFAFLICK